MSEAVRQRYWTMQVFRGEVNSEPLAVPSFGMVKEAVLVFPGAISLMDAQNLKPGMNLKVIKVDHLLPGDSACPIIETTVGRTGGWIGYRFFSIHSAKRQPSYAGEMFRRRNTPKDSVRFAIARRA